MKQWAKREEQTDRVLQATAGMDGDLQGIAGKPWKYLLIPHDEIAENMTLAGLASRFTVTL